MEKFIETVRKNLSNVPSDANGKLLRKKFEKAFPNFKEISAFYDKIGKNDFSNNKDIYKIFKHLSISTFETSKNIKLLEEKNISGIIFVDKQIKPTKSQIKNFTCIHIPINDDGSNLDFVIETATEFIYEMNKQNKKTLITDFNASSKSMSIILGYCMLKKQFTLETSFQLISNIKDDAFPDSNLILQLKEIEKEIFNLKESSIDHKKYICKHYGKLFQIKPEKIKKIFEMFNWDIKKTEKYLVSLNNFLV